MSVATRKARRAAQRQAAVPKRNTYPPGMVMVPCNDTARFHRFTYDLAVLELPDGSRLGFQPSSSIVENMNLLVEALLETDAEWGWIIGDDHVFKRDVVLRMLEHDVDIVAPLCARRGPPFALVACDELTGNLDHRGRPMYHIMDVADLPQGGLIEMAAIGTAGMLVRRRVFETLGFPWFANSDGITTNEDVEFCRRAREAGFKIWLDVDTTIGHIGTMVVWPDRKDEQWGITLDFQGQGANLIFLSGGIRPGDNGAPDYRTGTGSWE